MQLSKHKNNSDQRQNYQVHVNWCTSNDQTFEMCHEIFENNLKIMLAVIND